MDPRIQELLARLSEVSDEHLEEFLSDVLVGQLEAAAEAKDVEIARQLADAIDTVRGELKQRAELARQREQEIATIMSRVHAQSEGEEDPDSTDDGENDDADDDKEAEDDPATDSGSASTRSLDRPLPKIADLARSKRAAATTTSIRARQVTPDRKSGTTTVTAAADVPGITAGTELTDRVSIRKAVIERWQALSGSRTSGRIPVIRMQMNYPDDRVLKSGDEEGNFAKIQSLLSPMALTASGGICAPPAGYYDTNTLVTGARPLRDSLPVFGAERGGIRFIPSTSLADFGAAAIGVTTSTEDLGGATKPCATVTCEDAEDALVQAISRCLQFGNYNARTHPEYVTHLIDITIAAQARQAEQELWASMCSAATAVSSSGTLSAWRELYGSVAQAAAAFRSRHRMAPESVLRFAAPAWLADMLSVDITRQAPGDNTVAGVDRAAFGSWLSKLNVRVTWTLEGGNSPDQVFGAQAPGALLSWPGSVETILYPEGTYLFLDGGTLDLGVVRDSTLNVTNDFQLFAESFESVAFIGPEAYCMTLDVCASGLSAGHDDTPACAS